MKLRFTLIAVVLLLAFSQEWVVAQQTLIHYWNFNTLAGPFNNPAIPDFVPDFTLIDTNQARIKYVLEPGTSSSYAGYIDNVTSADVLNLRMNQTAGLALRVRNPTDSMELRFCIPTTGFKNIKLQYVLESSSTTSGMLTELFDYSADGGTTWKNAADGLTVNGSSSDTLDVTPDIYQGTNWGLVTITFGSDASVNDNAKLIFRIKFKGNTSLAKGNNRFDDVTVEGTPAGVSEVNASALSHPVECIMYPNPSNGTCTLATGEAGVKTVVISDMAGNVVWLTTQTQKDIIVNTGSLAAGRYHVAVSHGGEVIGRSALLIKE